MSTTVRRRDGGYATFPNRWIDAGYMAAAPGSVTQVYLFLCRWSDNTTLAAAQPMKLIAKKCGLSEDVARKAIRTLEAWQVIHREPESGPNAVNVWTLMDLLPKAPDYPDKLPPKLSGGLESGGAESGGTYQPNHYQPDYYQPAGVSLSADSQNSPQFSGGQRKRITPRWVPSPETERWANAEGWTTDDLSSEVERFRDHYIANGEHRANWDITFKNWLRNPHTLARRQGGVAVTGSTTRPKPAYYKANGGLTPEGMAAKARGEI